MAQSATTVTPENPTPPTNLSSNGAFPPNPPNLTRQTYLNWVGVGQVNAASGAAGAPPTGANPPPFFDDGVPALAASLWSLNEVSSSPTMLTSNLTYAANTAALASGTSAADNNTGTTAGTIATAAGGDGFNSAVGTYPVQGGLVPASASVAHEGAGNENLFTQSYSAAVVAPIVLKTVGCGPALTAGTMPVPNQLAGSSLSPATNPTLTSITLTSTVSGVGTVTQTCTGVGFTRQSVMVVNGVPQLTTFVSSTSLTAVVTKKASAGTWPVTVVTGGVVVTAAQTWTFT